MKHTTVLKFLLASSVFVPLAPAAIAAEQPPAPANPWKWTASVSAKEAYDSNVYLQSVTPIADQESLITTAILSLSGSYKSTDAFSASFDYAPEVNIFHSESSEDFILHRTALKLGGKSGKTSWEFTNSLILIDGSDEGLIFSGPGGAPAAGGPAIRDRRDALVERGQFKLTYTKDKWFVRPVVSLYVHDFQTVQKTTPGYLNYVDRSDWNGGLDAGYDLGKATWAVVGYRYGGQTQDQLFPDINPTHYDSTYHRVLFGIEGKPRDWIKFGLSFGPEFRTYKGSLPSTFEHTDETYLFLDSAITLTPNKKDTVTISAKRFEQPGFGGRSAYIDSTYDLTWRRKMSDKFTLGAGARAYNTNFFYPVLRNDWIYTANVMGAYTINKKWSGEFSYSYDTAKSEFPNMAGREYTRNYLAIGFKYIFR